MRPRVTPAQRHAAFAAFHYLLIGNRDDDDIEDDRDIIIFPSLIIIEDDIFPIDIDIFHII